jgi:hypothetical protein
VFKVISITSTDREPDLRAFNRNYDPREREPDEGVYIGIFLAGVVTRYILTRYCGVDI